MKELVEQYLPLANKLAFQKKKNLPRFIDIEDLKSAAYLGLVEAASRFNPNLGASFSTFAYPRIFGAIHDWLREQGWIKRGDLTPMISLDSPSEDGENFLRDLLPSREIKELEDNFELATTSLNNQGRQIMRDYFVNDLSMKDIGNRIGITESRVSQLISQYKNKIRSAWSERELRAELAA